MKIILLLMMIFPLTLMASVDTIIHVQWRQIEGPVQCIIDSANRPKTKAEGFTQPGIYKFEFTVTSKNGLSDSDTMQVTVSHAVLGVIKGDLDYKFIGSDEVIKWTVTGNNIQSVQLQKSYNGSTYDSILTGGIIGAKSYRRERPGTYFRLKIFTDGAYVYSKTIFIPGTKKMLTVRQEGKMAIINSEETGRFVLSDAIGRILLNGDVSVGDTRINIHPYDGVLFIRVLTINGIETFKMPGR